MRSFSTLAAFAALTAVATPAAAQYSQPYPYPQQYPQQGYPQQYPGYPQQGYGYPQQGYGQNPVGQIIDQLLGNRYNVTDRTAVSQCAAAAVRQASSQYGGAYINNGYGNRQGGYGYNQAYGAGMRVTAISDVQRRSSGLRVKGLIDSGRGYRGQYGGQGYAGQGYTGGDLTFRCDVDYRGAVTNLRIGQNMSYRGR